MKALITGGAGFIGSHLAERLLERGDEVCVIDDLSTGKLENVAHLRDNPRFHLAVETILNETVMDRLVSECDVIYHLAAAVGVELIVKSPVETIERNVLGSHVVLRLASRYLRKVLITSTSEIYGKSDSIPFSEEDDRVLGATTKSRWSYSCSKAIDEFLALAYHKEKGVPTVIMRLFNTVGPRQTGRYGMVIPRLVTQALAGRPLTVYGDGQQVRCFTFVEDVVWAAIRLMEEPAAVGQVFNVGNDKGISIADLARKIVEMTGSKSEISFVPYSEAYEEGFEDMRIRVPNLNKVRETIGYEPRVQLDEILRRVIEHFLAKKGQD
ncbi:MAG: Bifunctional polymyxin resistance protein ArnA [bacterium ADurb.Bin431]|nr:MAG: Bifunctional polymyxin resistance protein ArnA [bacterium ADurb.Bin431]HNY90324.1 GDP-mannose 4,6-dehydratase [bacterium]HPM60031.1 GDP-mannose 4,6-dehydratase [bacterium]